jgi:hypothetical protein
LPYEIDFLRAGNSNGDAIVVKWGDTKDGNFYLNLIDGGFTDTGDQIIDHIKEYYSTTAKIANVVLTRADNVIVSHPDQCLTSQQVTSRLCFDLDQWGDVSDRFRAKNGTICMLQSR